MCWKEHEMWLFVCYTKYGNAANKISMAAAYGGWCCSVTGLNQISITVACMLNLSVVIMIWCCHLQQFCLSGRIFTCIITTQTHCQIWITAVCLHPNKMSLNNIVLDVEHLIWISLRVKCFVMPNFVLLIEITVRGEWMNIKSYRYFISCIKRYSILFMI